MGMFTAYGKENGSPEKLQELYNFGNRRNIIMLKTEKLNLTQEWDKTFPKSDKVEHRKVTFVNRYGITLAADLYTPKDTEGKLAAIAVGGPGTPPPRTSTPRIFPPPWTSSTSRTMWTRRKLASSASAAGAAWP